MIVMGIGVLCETVMLTGFLKLCLAVLVGWVGIYVVIRYDRCVVVQVSGSELTRPPDAPTFYLM